MVNVSFGYISLSTCFEEDLISFWRLENRTKSFFELSIDCDDLVTIKISRKINMKEQIYKFVRPEMPHSNSICLMGNSLSIYFIEFNAVPYWNCGFNVNYFCFCRCLHGTRRMKMFNFRSHAIFKLKNNWIIEHNGEVASD